MSIDTNDMAGSTLSAPQRPVVLVVEDEVLVQMLVLEVLEDLGLEALEANDGPSALDIVRSGIRLDLLVTDVGLPGMNGRQLVEAARELRPELKVLFTSGFPDIGSAPSSKLADAILLTKPYRRDELATKVRQALAA